MPTGVASRGYRDREKTWPEELHHPRLEDKESATHGDQRVAASRRQVSDPGRSLNPSYANANANSKRSLSGQNTTTNLVGWA